MLERKFSSRPDDFKPTPLTRREATWISQVMAKITTPRGSGVYRWMLPTHDSNCAMMIYEATVEPPFVEFIFMAVATLSTLHTLLTHLLRMYYCKFNVIFPTSQTGKLRLRMVNHCSTLTQLVRGGTGVWTPDSLTLAFVCLTTFLYLHSLLLVFLKGP